MKLNLNDEHKQDLGDSEVSDGAQQENFVEQKVTVFFLP